MISSKRIFLGIPVTEGHLADLIGFQQIQERNRQIRWVPSENLHITVHFFGNTLIEEIPRLCSKLATIFSKTPPFKLEFKQFHVNPGNKPTMLWAVYYPQDNFHHLQIIIRDIFQKQQLQKPIIHCTLARFNSKSKHFIFDFASNLKNPFIDVRQVKLFESVLQPKGSVYTVLETFNLE